MIKMWHRQSRVVPRVLTTWRLLWSSLPKATTLTRSGAKGRVAEDSSHSAVRTSKIVWSITFSATFVFAFNLKVREKKPIGRGSSTRGWKSTKEGNRSKQSGKQSKCGLCSGGITGLDPSELSSARRMKLKNRNSNQICREDKLLYHFQWLKLGKSSISQEIRRILIQYFYAGSMSTRTSSYFGSSLMLRPQSLGYIWHVAL